MWTIEYKGSYIHGYFDKPECTVSFFYFADRHYTISGLKSLHAAKIAITKHLTNYKTSIE